MLARPGYTPAAARAHLDAFADVAAAFTASADRPNLGGFLAWLEAALKEERGLDKGYIEASPDAVQVLTVHAAKGLEWDAVAVPGPGRGVLPGPRLLAVEPRRDRVGGARAQATGAGAAGSRGAPLRPARRPRRPPGARTGAAPRTGTTSRRETESSSGPAGEHGIVEERRLAYVAFTRARADMLLTAPVWRRPGTRA